MRRCLLVLAVGMLAVPAAKASPVTAIARAPHAAPALSGPKVLWAQPLEHRLGAPGIAILTAPVAGGPSATLFSQARPIKGDEVSVLRVAASATRLAFWAIEGIAIDPDGATAYDVVRTAAPGEPFAISAGDLAGNTLVRGFDLSGDVLATLESQSYGDPGAVVRDLAVGGAPRRFGPPKVEGVQVAGPYVAVALPVAQGHKTGTIVVYERVTGAEVYRVRAPLIPPYDFDLQEDGTLAFVTADRGSTGIAPLDDVAWASIADPAPHVVATKVGALVGIAGDRILFSRTRPPASQELALADLAGATRPVSFPVDWIRNADFDGTQIAFSTLGCVYAGDVPEGEAPAEPPLGTCPQMAIRVTTAGSRPPTLSITCTMGPTSGCRGSATLRSEPSRGHRAIKLATASFSAAFGASTRVPLRISRRARAAWRRTIPRGRRMVYPIADVDAVDAAGLADRERTTFALRGRQ